MAVGQRFSAAFEPHSPDVRHGDVRRIAVLGSTGSIGENTLDLVGRQPEAFEITALAANRNIKLLVEQALRYRPKMAVLADQSLFRDLKDALAGTEIEPAAGRDAVIEAASMQQDLVMASIVGAAGLESALAAIKRGTNVALANKESLVSAGDLFVSEATANGASILPVDSEHNAIFQAFETRNSESVRTVTLTASGGPFRTWSLEQMAAASPEQALRHPNWSMGAKVTIDSATLMNKGLELIEAFHLFPVSENQLEVLIHPQSIVHGMVSYEDGSVLAQLGTPDMRTPISYCLGWPKRMRAPSEPLDLASAGTLSFEKPDLDRFPSLKLAREALRKRSGAACVLNAANEVAVDNFLKRKIGFLAIPALVETVLEVADKAGMLIEPRTLDAVLQLDDWARRTAEEQVRETAAKAC